VTAVTDAIAAELATLERVVPDPSEPLGWGVDIRCLTSVYPDLRETDPTSGEDVAEEVLRRLITPRGTVPDDPDYGFDLRGALNAALTLQFLQEVEARAQNEVLKDDRIATCEVKVTQSGTRELSVYVEVTCKDPTVTPPRFVLTVTDGAVHYEAING
jgi:phage baseplate assembly protein W